jgi:Lrp/AsnC family leucine-responsive transcriptional regulator
MNEKTEAVRRKREDKRRLDSFDRRILSALVVDAGQSYAALGERVGLSAPAVHERVRRLKQTGVLKGTHARLDGSAVDKPLLAFVHVEAAGWGKSERMMQLSRFPEVEEMHSIAGDASMILKVRMRNPQALEALLAQIHSLTGVTGTRSFIALSTYLDRPVQAEVTECWPVVPLPHD